MLYIFNAGPKQIQYLFFCLLLSISAVRLASRSWFRLRERSNSITNQTLNLRCCAHRLLRFPAIFLITPAAAALRNLLLASKHSVIFSLQMLREDLRACQLTDAARVIY